MTMVVFCFTATTRGVSYIFICRCTTGDGIEHFSTDNLLPRTDEHTKNESLKMTAEYMHIFSHLVYKHMTESSTGIELLTTFA
jgi:hypothetical protein